MFLDVIIEDDPGEEKEEGGVMPHQLANEAVVMDMKVQQIMVRRRKVKGGVSGLLYNPLSLEPALLYSQQKFTLSSAKICITQWLA